MANLLKKNEAQNKRKVRRMRQHVERLVRFYLDLTNGDNEVTESETAAVAEYLEMLDEFGSGTIASRSQSLALCKLAGWCFYNCDLAADATAKKQVVQSAVWIINRHGKQ